MAMGERLAHTSGLKDQVYSLACELVATWR